MKIAVFGCTGMLGGSLLESLERAGFEPVPVPEEQVDIRDAPTVDDAVSEIRPAAVINAAAYTDVDGCEENQHLAFDVNAVGAGNIARSADSAGAACLYISTDYVFDGIARKPRLETDQPNPQGIYAMSKREGERAVAGECKRWFVIRTSWLFGEGGKNFVDTMVKLAAERETLTVVNDQTGSPTYTVHLAGGISRVLKMYLQQGFGEHGIFHLTGAGTCTWYDFAKRIIAARPGIVREILPVSTSEYIQSMNRVIAPRPCYSVLSNEKIKMKYGVALPHWEDAMIEYLSL